METPSCIRCRYHATSKASVLDKRSLEEAGYDGYMEIGSFNTSHIFIKATKRAGPKVRKPSQELLDKHGKRQLLGTAQAALASVNECGRSRALALAP